ncbi:MAG: ABC transporter ATP-binding protein/permease [Treponema sp.]|jgi:ABC-type bacteriocin/lantibiotic exporter with double-glycine peptidase domain|nr:ABC transporter ATP-binding protein/permease [Treponema sp.]
MTITGSRAAKKNKLSRSLLSNAWYLYRLQWKYCRASLFFIVLLIPVDIGVSFCGVYLPGAAVNAVIKNFSMTRTIFSVGTVGLLLAVFNTASQLITTYNFALMTKFREAIVYLKTQKVLRTDYQNLESPDYRIMAQRADEVLWGTGNGSAVEQMAAGGAAILTNIIRYILFGAMLSFASPLIVLLLTITPVVNYFLIKAVQKYQYANRDETAKLDRKLWYISNRAGDFKAAKDIRVYSMGGWLAGLYKKLSRERLGWDKKYAIKYFYTDIVSGIIILLRDCAVYAILITMALDNRITIDVFVMYFAAASGFVKWVSGIISELSSLTGINFMVNDLRDFLACPEKNNRGRGQPLPRGACAISLRDVSYRHEGADRETISRVSLEIQKGEKIAVVGLNGAGKTTLIKLICGLYAPSGGDIYVNGVNAKDYNVYDYYKIFSVVFQDHHFLPISLSRIVACSRTAEENREKVRGCVKIAGLQEKADSLPGGLDTPLNKQINKDGVELSGGEEQKLLLARALYKDGPVLILDEPTAALDPIAERDLYTQYGAICAGKTAIFISHRLASTKFCDRILFMENGTIAESGTHEALMGRGGKYAALFKTQSRYYTE